MIEEIKPDVLIHCAALANVDLCARPDCADVNADLPAELAKTSGETGIKMVHISTDAVFDGETGITLKTIRPIHWACMLKISGGRQADWKPPLSYHRPGKFLWLELEW